MEDLCEIFCDPRTTVPVGDLSREDLIREYHAILKFERSGDFTRVDLSRIKELEQEMLQRNIPAVTHLPDLELQSYIESAVLRDHEYQRAHGFVYSKAKSSGHEEGRLYRAARAVRQAWADNALMDHIAQLEADRAADRALIEELQARMAAAETAVQAVLVRQ